jgi:hypothetical protein
LINLCNSELLLPEPSSRGVLVAIGKLKTYKLPGFDHIPSELIQAGDNTLCSEIDYFVNFVLNERNLLLCLCIRRTIKVTVIIFIEVYQKHLGTHASVLVNTIYDYCGLVHGQQAGAQS